MTIGLPGQDVKIRRRKSNGSCGIFARQVRRGRGEFFDAEQVVRGEGGPWCPRWRRRTRIPWQLAQPLPFRRLGQSRTLRRTWIGAFPSFCMRRQSLAARSRPGRRVTDRPCLPCRDSWPRRRRLRLVQRNDAGGGGGGVVSRRQLVRLRGGSGQQLQSFRGDDADDRHLAVLVAPRTEVDHLGLPHRRA